jgi:hypothetical protein
MPIFITALAPKLDKLVLILEFSLKQPTPAGAGLKLFQNLG